jgi:hypothetical protein
MAGPVAMEDTPACINNRYIGECLFVAVHLLLITAETELVASASR